MTKRSIAIDENQEEAVQQDVEQAAALTEENKNLRDQLLRSVADFDNYRRRVASEREEVVSRANARILSELLPFADDLRRCMEVSHVSSEAQALYDGFAMVYKKFISYLESKGVRQFSVIGEHFDVDRHEAIARQHSDADEDTIIAEVEPGYMYNDTVLRFAKVVVSAGSPE